MTPYQHPPQPPIPQYQTPQQVQYVYYVPQKSAGTAAVLELLPGIFFQVYGIGHMYAGNIAVGLLVMFGWWFVLAVNIMLCFLFIGFLTLPVCWLAMAIISPVCAAQSVSKRPY